MRSCASSLFKINVGFVKDAVGLLRAYTDKGHQVLVTAVPMGGAEETENEKRGGQSSIYWKIDLREKTCLVLGNEGHGVSTNILSMSLGNAKVTKVHVPLAERVESLNVGVCGAVILFESLRQRAA